MAEQDCTQSLVYMVELEQKMSPIGGTAVRITKPQNAGERYKGKEKGTHVLTGILKPVFS
jgi:hypothetical protein